jgi:hypothetical protein
MSLYTFAAKPRLHLCWICEESSKSSEEGRENEFIYFRGQAAFAFVLGCEESRNPAKKGERMRLLPLRPIDRVWLRAGFEKRVPNPAKKGERMRLLPLRPIDRVWLRAGFVKRVPNPAKKE